MLNLLEFPGHEMVVFAGDEESGLRAIIALHSTARGPAAGGVRLRPYRRVEDALHDVLELSRAMTLKNAIADLPLGGGKAVIIADPNRDKTEALFEAFGRAVDRLGGHYWAAEDMGVGPDDMAVVARTTRYVAGLPTGPFAGGDPSPVTAAGVFEGIKIALRHTTGSEALAGRTVAVQGLGHVGSNLCALLREAGADLIITDLNAALLAEAQREYGVLAVSPEEIYTVQADVFAPCAGGGILNEATISRLNVRVVAGAANNQLETSACANHLANRGILYAPDFVINAGGIINVAAEILRVRNPDDYVTQKLNGLTATLDEVLGQALREGRSPLAIAEEIATRRIGQLPN
jgi:leucine dehydrogenase